MKNVGESVESIQSAEGTARIPATKTRTIGKPKMAEAASELHPETEDGPHVTQTGNRVGRKY